MNYDGASILETMARIAAFDHTTCNRLSQEEFAAFASRFLAQQVMPILEAKGREYSQEEQPEEPALVNMLEGAALLEISPAAYLLTLATKHWHALCKWARGRRPGTTRATIAERVRDIVVYMLLLAFMTAPEQTSLQECSPDAKPDIRRLG